MRHIQRTASNVPVMNRLTTVLSTLRERRKKALALFLTAGYPAADSTPDLSSRLPRRGDIIEIGMPFPIRSRRSGDTAKLCNRHWERRHNHGILDGIRKIRESSTVPLCSWVHQSDTELRVRPIFRDAASSGADGVILPELTLEESVRFKTEIDRNGLSQILLVHRRPFRADNRDRCGVRRVSLLCVDDRSHRQRREGDAGGFPVPGESLREEEPALVGFGISTAAEARHAALLSDGVIIGRHSSGASRKESRSLP